MTHSHAGSKRGLDQQRILREEGVDLSRVLIGHSNETGDIDYRAVSTWDIIRDPSAKSFDVSICLCFGATLISSESRAFDIVSTFLTPRLRAYWSCVTRLVGASRTVSIAASSWLEQRSTRTVSLLPCCTTCVSSCASRSGGSSTRLQAWARTPYAMFRYNELDTIAGLDAF